MKKAINTIEEANFICDIIKQKASTGKTFMVDVFQARKPRSPTQNKLYWVWVNAIVVQTMGVINGRALKTDIDLMHNELRRKLLPLLDKLVLGKKTKTLTSTADLSKEEFAHYLSSVKALALEYDVYLYSEEEKGFNEFYHTYNERK